MKGVKVSLKFESTLTPGGAADKRTTEPNANQSFMYRLRLVSHAGRSPRHLPAAIAIATPESQQQAKRPTRRTNRASSLAPEAYEQIVRRKTT